MHTWIRTFVPRDPTTMGPALKRVLRIISRSVDMDGTPEWFQVTTSTTGVTVATTSRTLSHNLSTMSWSNGFFKEVRCRRA